MSFQDAVRTTLTTKYATFTGRARRSEYWFFALFNVIVSIITSAIDRAIPGDIQIVGTIVGLALLVPGLAVGARRLHDTGRSGWWQLIGLIPVVGWIVLIVFLVQEGKPGANEHGPNPKESAAVGYAAPPAV
jgi:uncharacterized membrane protein YhaH (DUF805 family)